MMFFGVSGLERMHIFSRDFFAFKFVIGFYALLFKACPSEVKSAFHFLTSWAIFYGILASVLVLASNN